MVEDFLKYLRNLNFEEISIRTIGSWVHFYKKSNSSFWKEDDFIESIRLYQDENNILLIYIIHTEYTILMENIIKKYKRSKKIDKIVNI